MDDLQPPAIDPNGMYNRAELATFLDSADRACMSDVDMARILRLPLDRVIYARGAGRKLVTKPKVRK
jgi:hypothetical protein